MAISMKIAVLLIELLRVRLRVKRAVLELDMAPYRTMDVGSEIRDHSYRANF